jgi:hypothetical protein
MTDHSPATASQALGPLWRCPLGPSAVVPDFLHRRTDGWVPLARKVGEQWQELGSVPAHDLCGLFADEIFTEVVQADGFFGLHAMYRPAPRRLRHTLPGLQPSLRNIGSVRYLTCCHVDLDGYKHGLDTHGMIAAVMQLVDEGTLPPPSLFTLSRGVWALWRIHDRLKVGEPLRAYPESVMTRWCRVQGALTRVCAAIGSDAAAKHAATVTRIPGSVNTKNGRRVGYMVPADLHGKPFTYTLDDLEAALRPHFAIAAEVVHSTAPKPKNLALSERGLKGWRGRWRRLLNALGQLRDMRGGWKLGHRNSALLYVSLTLRGLRASGEEVRRVLKEHLAWMEQPAGDGLRMSHAMRVYRSVKRIRGRGASLQAVADALDVSPDEAALLSEGRRKSFPPAARHVNLRLPEPAPLPQGAVTARRRAVVKAICDELLADGIAPNGATVAAFLTAQGISAAPTTVLNDMRAVGCPSCCTRRRRRRASADAAGAQTGLFAGSSFPPESVPVHVEL